MPITKRITLLRDYAEDAAKLKGSYGKTELFSTGAQHLDHYLGGGFGRPEGYEIVLLFGPTKIGKSFVGLNFLRAAVEQGKKVGIMALEDDGPDVFLRFCDILGPEATKAYVMKGETVFMMPEEATRRAWKLDDLVSTIEEWYTQLGVELILLDHLQFAFENAEQIRGENEYIQQRVFMQRLNHLMKRMKKTIILVSHINKDSKAKGVYKIVGSGGIAAAATKILEVSKDEGRMFIQEHGARFVATPTEPHEIMLNGNKLEDAVYGVHFS
jgi:KaiC/GvpD/RAD55 family RecA-like ATPase